jgi:hypothetical protein
MCSFCRFPVRHVDMAVSRYFLVLSMLYGFSILSSCSVYTGLTVHSQVESLLDSGHNTLLYWKTPLHGASLGCMCLEVYHVRIFGVLYSLSPSAGGPGGVGVLRYTLLSGAYGVRMCVWRLGTLAIERCWFYLYTHIVFILIAYSFSFIM